MAGNLIRNAESILEIFQRACNRRELLILATPYLRVDSHFVRMEGNEVHVAATMSRDDAMYGLKSNALRMRYLMLPAARKRAGQLNEAGALFPWRTINGEEASAYYAAGTAQYHINADVSFALGKYVRATGDDEFLYREGVDIAVETARLWSTLGFWRFNEDGAPEVFHIHGVTGPDEYTTVVNDNLFTNVMARYNLRFAARVVTEMAERAPEEYALMAERLGLGAEEAEGWDAAAEAMHIPYSEGLGIHPQDAVFLEREVWDLESTPPEQRPLLLHFHPLVIYRYQVLKQADVVLALYLQGNHFTDEEKLADFEYYDPLTTGDSTLSAVVQAILAAEVGYQDLALEYFRESIFVDLCDAHPNLLALNFYIRGLLGDGVASSTRLDPQAKTLRHLKVRFDVPPRIEHGRSTRRFRGDQVGGVAQALVDELFDEQTLHRFAVLNADVANLYCEVLASSWPGIPAYSRVNRPLTFPHSRMLAGSMLCATLCPIFFRIEMDDILWFLAWYAALLVAGILGLPLAWRGLGSLPDRGLTLARLVGLLAIATVYGLIALTGFVATGLPSAILAIAIVAWLIIRKSYRAAYAAGSSEVAALERLTRNCVCGRRIDSNSSLFINTSACGMLASVLALSMRSRSLCPNSRK